MRFSLLFTYILISILSLVFMAQAADAVAVVLSSAARSVCSGQRRPRPGFAKGTVLYDGDKIKTAVFAL